MREKGRKTARCEHKVPAAPAPPAHRASLSGLPLRHKEILSVASSNYTRPRHQIEIGLLCK